MNRLIRIASALFFVIAHYGATAQRQAPPVVLDTSITHFRFQNSSVSPAGPESNTLSDVSLSNYDLLTAALKFEFGEGFTKATLAPWRLHRGDRNAVQDAFRMSFSNKAGSTTVGIGSGVDNSTYYGKRGKRLWNDVYLADLMIRHGAPLDANWTTAQITAHDKRNLDDALLKYYEHLAWYATKFTIGVNYAFFEVVGGDDVDADGDSLVDNAHGGQGVTFVGNFTQNLGRDLSISVSPTYAMKYAGPGEAFKERVPQIGLTVGGARRIILFNRDFRTAKDYAKTLFVPGMNLGFSFEYMVTTDSKEYLKDGIDESRTFTPYVDFVLSPTSQFRLGVPFKSVSKLEGAQLDASVLFQYTLQLVDLTK